MGQISNICHRVTQAVVVPMSHFFEATHVTWDIVVGYMQKATTMAQTGIFGAEGKFWMLLTRDTQYMQIKTPNVNQEGTSCTTVSSLWCTFCIFAVVPFIKHSALLSFLQISFRDIFPF